MTTNPNVDNLDENGAGGSPSHSVSSGEGGSIKDSDQLSKLLKAEIAEALKPVLSEVRGVQGRQDKDRTAFREFMDEFKKQKAKGLSDDAAEVAAETSIKERTEALSDKQLLRQIAEKVLGTSPAGNGVTANANVVDVLKQYPELDANDTDVVAKVLSLTDPKEAEYQALKLIRSRANQTTPSASAASPLSGTPPKPTNDAEKIARLAELQKTPSKFKAEIKKLEEELGWAK
jgi:hypothetical protein